MKVSVAKFSLISRQLKFRQRSLSLFSVHRVKSPQFKGWSSHLKAKFLIKFQIHVQKLKPVKNVLE